MNLPLIRELQDFSDSFNLKISQAIERYDNHINELNRPVKTVPSCFSAPKKIKISKKKYSNDIFKEPPLWKDPKHHGRYFDKLKLLKAEHEPTSLELYRVNLIKRSYEKPTNMLDCNFVCRSLVSRNLNNPLIETRNFTSLSPLGRSIITKFITSNERKMKEKEWTKFIHTKKKEDKSNWRYPRAHGEIFSEPGADSVYTYKKEKRPKPLNEIPFRIPKKKGTFFDKSIKLL